MAAKSKKQEVEFGKNPESIIGQKIEKTFKLKADIRVMKEQRELAMKGVVEKLGDISGIDTYTEKDLGNGVFITVTPPYEAQRFDPKVYTEWLQNNGLLDEAYRKHIYMETEEVRDTLRFSSEYIGKSASTFASFINYISCADIPDLAETCADLKVEIKKLENEYKNTVNQIMSDGLEKLGDGIFDLKYIYNNGDISGTLSFSHSTKRNFDLKRLEEMLPVDMSEEDKNKILKSRTVVISSPVVAVLTEDSLKKIREYIGNKELIEEPEMSI